MCNTAFSQIWYYKNSVLDNKTILKSHQRFKSDLYTIYTEDVNKIAISSNDDKRLQRFNKITTYPYGTNAFKVCQIKQIASEKYLKDE